MSSRLVPLIASAIAFIDFVSAIIEATKVDTGKVHRPLWQLYLVPEFSLAYLTRLAFLSVFVVAMYVIVMTRYYRKTPMTIVRTRINVALNDDCSSASFDRSMIIRANEPNVSAYYSSCKPSIREATVEEVRMNAYCEGAKLDNFTELFYEGNGFEAFHSFGRNLRHRWFMLLIPINFMNKEYDELPKWMRKNLTRRSQHWVYRDEFSGSQPYMDFLAKDYPQHNIRVRLSFSKKPNDLKVRRIALHGVTDIVCFDDANGDVCFRVEKLEKEKIRISWRNSLTQLPAPTPSAASTPSTPATPAS